MAALGNWATSRPKFPRAELCLPVDLITGHIDIRGAQRCVSRMRQRLIRGPGNVIEFSFKACHSSPAP